MALSRYALEMLFLLGVIHLSSGVLPTFIGNFKRDRKWSEVECGRKVLRHLSMYATPKWFELVIVINEPDIIRTFSTVFSSFQWS